MRYFKRIWSWVDLLMLIISIIILAQFYIMILKKDENGFFRDNYDDYVFQTTALRIQLMLGQMLLFSKS